VPTLLTSSVTALSGCGNGQVGSEETCDDGNAVSGDGCSSTCRAEAGYDCQKYQGKLCFKEKASPFSTGTLAGIICGAVLLVVAVVIAVMVKRAQNGKTSFEGVDAKPRVQV
jgi:cysteine-rich repeat protein